MLFNVLTLEMRELHISSRVVSLGACSVLIRGLFLWIIVGIFLENEKLKCNEIYMFLGSIAEIGK